MSPILPHPNLYLHPCPNLHHSLYCTFIKLPYPALLEIPSWITHLYHFDTINVLHYIMILHHYIPQRDIISTNIRLDHWTTTISYSINLHHPTLLQDISILRTIIIILNQNLILSHTYPFNISRPDITHTRQVLYKMSVYQQHSVISGTLL